MRTVQLVQDNTIIDNANASPNGNYRFENVAPGTYTMKPASGTQIYYHGHPGVFTFTVLPDQRCLYVNTMHVLDDVLPGFLLQFC